MLQISSRLNNQKNHIVRTAVADIVSVKQNMSVGGKTNITNVNVQDTARFTKDVVVTNSFSSQSIDDPNYIPQLEFYTMIYQSGINGTAPYVGPDIYYLTSFSGFVNDFTFANKFTLPYATKGLYVNLSAEGSASEIGVVEVAICSGADGAVLPGQAFGKDYGSNLSDNGSVVKYILDEPLDKDTPFVVSMSQTKTGQPYMRLNIYAICLF